MARLTPARSSLLAALILLVLALPGFFTLPPVDRDEARFATASAQMLASGDWIEPRLGDQARLKKPVGIYWLQAASAAVTGQPGAIWSYRLVSALAAALAVALTVRIAALVVGPGAALLAGLMLAASLVMGGEARLAKTDAAQLAALLAAQAVLARGFLGAARGAPVVLGRGAAMGFWAALAVAILIKGPIAPLVAATTLGAACLWRRDLALWRALRPVPGIALLMVLALPWFVAITMKSGGAFWQESVAQDLLAKVGQGQENHGAPPGSYLAAVWATFWPGAALLAAAVPALWRGRRTAVVVFLAGWAGPVWLLFELTATKLIHYTLPAYPALAIATVWALSQSRPGRWARGLATLVALCVPAALGLALWLGLGKIGGVAGGPYWAGLAVMAAGTLALVAGLWRHDLAAMATGTATGGLGLALALYPTLAAQPGLWPSVALAEAARAHPGCRLVSLGYEEPSLLFLTGSTATFVREGTLPQALAAPGCVLLAITPDRAAEAAALPALTPAGQVTGLNLGSGRKVTAALYLRP